MATRKSPIQRHPLAELSLTTLIDLFITSKQVEGRSNKTLIWYRANLSRFAEFLSGSSTCMPDTCEIPATLNDINLENARSFILHLQNRSTRYDEHPLHSTKAGGLSPYTIHSYVQALKVFSSWLFEEGYTTTNLLTRLKRPKLPQPVIEILSDEEIDRVMAAINPNSFLGARLHAIVLLLLDTGIRASELCSLKLANTFLKEGYIVVHGKGDKERIVPFGGTTKKAILRYVQIFKPLPMSDEVDELILTVDGRSLGYDGLQQQQFQL